jgi:GDP-L-fucose synthase
MKTVLITGSTGFVGKNLVLAFRNKYNLLLPNHYELDLLNKKDVMYYFQMHEEIDTIIHCANFGGNRKTAALPGQVLTDNLRMFFNLVENKEQQSRLINLGSGAEYNKYRNLWGIKETEFGKLVPPDEYGFSKFIISHYIEKTLNMYSLRVFGLFGRYEDYEYRFISNAIVKNLLHMPITIRQNVQFSWLYVDDLVKIIDRFITITPHNSVYNVTPPESIDLVTIAETINSVSDYNSEIIVENPGYNFDYSGDNERLIECIRGLSFTPMKTAIQELIRYYRGVLPGVETTTIRKDPYAERCVINTGAK